MSDVWFHMSGTRCVMLDICCLLSELRCVMSDVLHQISNVICMICQTFGDRCLIDIDIPACDVRTLISYMSDGMSDMSYFLWQIWDTRRLIIFLWPRATIHSWLPDREIAPCRVIKDSVKVGISSGACVLCSTPASHLPNVKKSLRASALRKLKNSYRLVAMKWRNHPVEYPSP